MMPRIRSMVARALQMMLVHIGRLAALLLPWRRRPITWVVGPEETAALVHYAARVIPGSYAVDLAGSRFYGFTYDRSIRDGGNAWRMMQRLVIGPLLLGHLSVRAKGFLYIGASGFLLNPDQREREFAFLSRHGLRIACMFCGSDIRSPRLMQELERHLQLENIATYLPLVSPRFGSAAFETIQQRVAAVAERHAGLIITAATDQRGYLTRRTTPFIYLHPDEGFHRCPEKFRDLSRPRLVHAPSLPLIKGTQLVRAAITRLRREGRSFEYIELHDVANDEILRELRAAHIVLNEFYAFVPGMFGIEAMANYCVLMTSADEAIETDLPSGSNTAWVTTRHFEVYDRLKDLLDRPGDLAAQADAGHRWALEHASFSRSGERLRRALDAC